VSVDQAIRRATAYNRGVMPHSPIHFRAPWFQACLAGVMFLAWLAITEPCVPLGWDEGESIERAERAADWTRSLSAAGGFRQALSSERLFDGWRYARTGEGHPALCGWLMLPTWLASGDELPSRGALRWGAMLFCALGVGVAAWRMTTEYSGVAAWGGVLALATSPRLLVHAHFTTWDGPLMAAWLLAWGTFPRRPMRTWGGLWRYAGWGVVLGMLLSAKFTGWLALGSFGAWILIYQRRVWGEFLLVCVPVALGTFVLLNPPLWRATLAGLWEFWTLNLGRHEQAGLNISTQFFGRMYNLDFPAPWYSPWVWLAMVVPLPQLLLASASGWEWWRVPTRRAAIGLVMMQALAPVVAQMFPGVPKHDAERLILPSLAFVALLAGIGIDAAWQRVGAWQFGRVARAALVALAMAPLTSVWWYWPQGLSYYNLVIGGLRGATARGCEATYYWDALGEQALAWLRDHTAQDGVIALSAAPPANLRMLRRWGELPEVVPATNERARWYVVQMRPSAWSEVDRWLIAQKEPAFEYAIGARDEGIGPWRLEVPLLLVFEGDDLRQAEQALRTSEGPETR